jgi:hypothetical protein
MNALVFLIVFFGYSIAAMNTNIIIINNSTTGYEYTHENKIQRVEPYGQVQILLPWSCYGNKNYDTCLELFEPSILPIKNRICSLLLYNLISADSSGGYEYYAKLEQKKPCTKDLCCILKTCCQAHVCTARLKITLTLENDTIDNAISIDCCNGNTKK